MSTVISLHSLLSIPLCFISPPIYQSKQVKAYPFLIQDSDILPPAPHGVYKSKNPALVSALLNALLLIVSGLPALAIERKMISPGLFLGF